MGSNYLNLNTYGLSGYGQYGQSNPLATNASVNPDATTGLTSSYGQQPSLLNSAVSMDTFTPSTSGIFGSAYEYANPYSQASNPYNGVSGLLSMLGLGAGQSQGIPSQFTQQQSFITPIPSPAQYVSVPVPTPEPPSADMSQLITLLTTLISKLSSSGVLDGSSSGSGSSGPSSSTGDSGTNSAAPSPGSTSSSGSSGSADSSGSSGTSASSGSSGSSSSSGSSGTNCGSFADTGKVTLFGGSQSDENNIDFTNKTDKDIVIYVQKNLDLGEQDPSGTVFKISAHSKKTVSAPDNKGLRFQKYGDTLPSDKQGELDKSGSVGGITAPAKTGTLYESNYDPSKHLSWDDISPLDGANIPMSMSGTGGRTVHFTQDIIDGAPGKGADGYVPGLGPDVTSAGNNAANPALRDYYERTSKSPDGTRAFYFNSSAGGEADKANVSYTGSKGQVRTTVDWG